MAVQENIRPDYTQKTLQGLKADRTVVRLTFNKSEAKENETLQVTIPKLHKNELIKPNCFKLLADVDLSEGDENNFLVNNFGRAVVSMLTVKFGGQLLNQIMGYDIYKIYEDLYLPRMKRSNMIEQGVQSVDLNKIRSNSADKKTSGVDTENKLNAVYGSKYCIPIDHPILSQNGAFYPHFLRDELLFEITLAQAAHVVKGPDQSKLTYTLKNIQLQYEIIKSRELAEIAEYEYKSGKEFIFDHIDRFKNEEFDLSDKGLLNFSVNVMKNSLKAVLLLFIKPYGAGQRESEKFFNPDITKVRVSMNGSPNKIYNFGLERRDAWEEMQRYFMEKNGDVVEMSPDMFYAGDRYGLLIDLRSMPSPDLHSTGKKFINNTNNNLYLKIEREKNGSGKCVCHMFLLSDAQMDIQDSRILNISN